MEQTPSTTLAAQAGAITAAICAEANQRAAQAGVVAALHALILAALARLFAGLENLLHLWQAGQLPASGATAPCRSPASAAAPHPSRHAVPGLSRPCASAPRTTQPAAGQHDHARHAAASSAVAQSHCTAAPRQACAPWPQARSARRTAAARTAEGFFTIFALHAPTLNCA